MSLRRGEFLEGTGGGWMIVPKIGNLLIFKLMMNVDSDPLSETRQVARASLLGLVACVGWRVYHSANLAPALGAGLIERK